MNKETHIKELQQFAQLLKENGYIVIIQDPEATYFHFWKQDVLGYVQKEYFSGYGFSYEYKPSREHGTGQRVFEMTELTLKNAQHTISMAAKRREKEEYNHSRAPQFWNSPQEFINGNKWAKYLIMQ